MSLLYPQRRIFEVFADYLLFAVSYSENAGVDQLYSSQHNMGQVLFRCHSRSNFGSHPFLSTWDTAVAWELSIPLTLAFTYPTLTCWGQTTRLSANTPHTVPRLSTGFPPSKSQATTSNTHFIFGKVFEITNYLPLEAWFCGHRIATRETTILADYPAKNPTFSGPLRFG